MNSNKANGTGSLYIRAASVSIPAYSDDYCFDLPLMQYFKSHESLAFPAPVTYFVGENGMGKSTLLEAIAISYGFNPEGGSRNFTNSSLDTHSELHKHMTLIKSFIKPRDGFFLRAESLYNVATEIERLNEITPIPLYDSYGGKSLHAQSHGESFLNLVVNRFGGQGMYLLDEPEAALSPTRQLSLMAAIQNLVAEGSQFIIATHSPILMSLPGSAVLSFSENSIAEIDYRETEHFQLTRQFLNNPEGFFKHLFL